MRLPYTPAWKASLAAGAEPLRQAPVGAGPGEREAEAGYLA